MEETAIAFGKAAFGGYRMDDVDEYVDVTQKTLKEIRETNESLNAQLQGPRDGVG